MPNKKNQLSLEEIRTDLSQSLAVIISDHSGLSVADQTDLRQKTAQSGSKFTVAKNSLLSIAFKEKLGDLPSELEKALNGPTSVLFAKKDAATAAKALYTFKGVKEKPVIKIGLMGDKIVGTDELEALSKLPSREQLLSNLLAQISAPAQHFTAVLAAPVRNLVFALNAIANK